MPETCGSMGREGGREREIWSSTFSFLINFNKPGGGGRDLLFVYFLIARLQLKQKKLLNGYTGGSLLYPWTFQKARSALQY